MIGKSPIRINTNHGNATNVHICGACESLKGGNNNDT
jgi:hypothetical protein